jgi:uncharacterized membrane protein
MRSIGFVAGIILLTGCGGSPAENNVASGETPAQAPVNVTTTVRETNEVASHPPRAGEATGGAVSPCLVQGAEQLPDEPLRAVGTEPFWGARIEGRCVTYSHPDDQKGTRVWTRYTETGDGRGAWIGQLEGKTFELRTRPQPGCSDGMSETRYPIAVDLLVNGERRQGCAEPV